MTKFRPGRKAEGRTVSHVRAGNCSSYLLAYSLLLVSYLTHRSHSVFVEWAKERYQVFKSCERKVKNRKPETGKGLERNSSYLHLLCLQFVSFFIFSLQAKYFFWAIPPSPGKSSKRPATWSQAFPNLPPKHMSYCIAAARFCLPCWIEMPWGLGPYLSCSPLGFQCSAHGSCSINICERKIWRKEGEGQRRKGPRERRREGGKQ